MSSFDSLVPTTDDTPACVELTYNDTDNCIYLNFHAYYTPICVSPRAWAGDPKTIDRKKPARNPPLPYDHYHIVIKAVGNQHEDAPAYHNPNKRQTDLLTTTQGVADAVERLTDKLYPSLQQRWYDNLSSLTQRTTAAHLHELQYDNYWEFITDLAADPNAFKEFTHGTKRDVLESPAGNHAPDGFDTATEIVCPDCTTAWWQLVPPDYTASTLKYYDHLHCPKCRNSAIPNSAIGHTAYDLEHDFPTMDSPNALLPRDVAPLVR